MIRNRFVVGSLAAAALLVAAAAPAAAASAAAGSPTTTFGGSPGIGPAVSAGVPLVHGNTAFPPRLHVVAADATTILYATEDYGEILQGYVQDYYTVPVGGGPVTRVAVTVDKGRLDTGMSAGSTFAWLTDGGQTNWLDMDTGRSGLGPSQADFATDLWESVIPGAGVWVDVSGNHLALFSSTTAHPTTFSTLGAVPDIPKAALDDAYPLGGTTGVAVVAGTTIDWYSFATHAFSKLDTTGVGSPLSCRAVTADAVACTSATRVFRVPTDGSAPTSFPAVHVGHLVVTPTSTAWQDSRTGQLVSRSTTGVVRRGAVVTDLTAGGNTIASSVIGVGASTVYRNSSATARTALVVARAPLQASTLELTAGRAGWIDDSTPTFPARARRLANRNGTLGLGPVVVVSGRSSADANGDDDPDHFISGLGLSASRAVLTSGYDYRSDSAPDVLLVDSSGRHVIGHRADGTVAISGTRVLYRVVNSRSLGSVLLYNAVDHSTRDLTAAFGLQREPTAFSVSDGLSLTGVGYGRYVVYERAGGVYRADLAAGGSTRIGSTSNRGPGFADARTAGDWVAWTTVVGGHRRIEYRNARTLGATLSLPGWSLLSVSQAGLVGTNPVGATVFRAWGSTAGIVLPQGASVDGPVVGWIGADGLPRAAAFTAGAARPQALGAPLATGAVVAGRTWRLDQPTSQVLSSCIVVIRNPDGAVVARLRCDPAFAAVGEAVVTWNGRSGGRQVPAGRYRWQLVAVDASGSVLSSTGTPGVAVGGPLTVHN